MRINCNFVMMVGLTNDERCLIHSLLVEKQTLGFQKNYENAKLHDHVKKLLEALCLDFDLITSPAEWLVSVAHWHCAC